MLCWCQPWIEQLILPFLNIWTWAKLISTSWKLYLMVHCQECAPRKGREYVLISQPPWQWHSIGDCCSWPHRKLKQATQCNLSIWVSVLIYGRKRNFSQWIPGIAFLAFLCLFQIRTPNRSGEFRILRKTIK